MHDLPSEAPKSTLVDPVDIVEVLYYRTLKDIGLAKSGMVKSVTAEQLDKLFDDPEYSGNYQWFRRQIGFRKDKTEIVYTPEAKCYKALYRTANGFHWEPVLDTTPFSIIELAIAHRRSMLKAGSFTETAKIGEDTPTVTENI